MNVQGNITRRLATAFTLTQLIGAVAVMAILVAAITPVAIKRIDIASQDAEATSLSAMAEALAQSSVKNKIFPATNTIPQVIATYLDVATNTVRVNKRGMLRVFLADPNASLNGGGLPYSQDAGGASTPPSGVRYLILSSVGKALPAINATNFNNIWTTAKGTIPSSLSSWGGRADDLLVERIELGTVFRKVLIMNLDRAPSVAIYAIDNFTTNSVSPQTRFASYYIDGTVLTLYKPDGNIDFRETLQNDFSLAYQSGKWSREMSSNEGEDGDFGQLVNRFLQGPVPCEPESGATQRAVINAFYDYMWGYADWAFGDTTASPAIPPFAGAGSPSTPQYPSYTVVGNAVTHLGGSAASFTANLIK